ncbi:MAG TPA: cytochrome P450 [Acidimicrobiales bacterium]|nr:cytochrome P450 [Acidimicrobiales bacterium]
MSLTASPLVYDPSTPDFQANMYSVYRRLRDEQPVYVGASSFALSRFEDVWRAVNDWETFSSVVAEANSLLPQMIYFDPPRHTAMRALVSRAFTPKRVAEVEALVRSTARSMIDGIAAAGGCELQHEFAAVLPSVVIAKMIGVEEEHIPQFRTWTESFLEITGPEDYQDAAGKIYGLFASLLAARREAPRDDLMTALIEAEVDGQRLTDDELLGFCLLLILAGNDTTSSLIGSGTVLLAQNPDQRELLVANPSLWPKAIEEMNRVESPTQVLPRTTTRDVTLHGVTMPAGSRVMLIWGSANHDEREFPDPERFDITRTITRHLAFGHGIHYCLGANLARLEARVAFEEWHQRFPRYALAGEPERIVSIWARAYRRVPIAV